MADISLISENGLLAELSYLKLEDNRFNGNIPDENNIVEFLNNVEFKNYSDKEFRLPLHVLLL